MTDAQHDKLAGELWMSLEQYEENLSKETKGFELEAKFQ